MKDEVLKALVGANNFIMYRPAWNKFTGGVHGTIILQTISSLCFKAQKDNWKDTPIKIASLQRITGLTKRQVRKALLDIAFKKGKTKNLLTEDQALITYYTSNKRGNGTNTYWNINKKLLAFCLENLSKSEEIMDNEGFLSKGTNRELLKSGANRELLIYYLYKIYISEKISADAGESSFTKSLPTVNDKQKESSPTTGQHNRSCSDQNISSQTNGKPQPLCSDQNISSQTNGKPQPLCSDQKPQPLCSDQKPPAPEKEFSLEVEIEKLKAKTNRRTLRVIGLYFEVRNINIPTKDLFQIQLRRNLRAAKEVAPYTNHQIETAMQFSANKYPEWTLETVAKTLLKMPT